MKRETINEKKLNSSLMVYRLNMSCNRSYVNIQQQKRLYATIATKNIKINSEDSAVKL